MSVDVATLQVNLTAGTATFTGPLNKAGQEAKNAARNIQDSLNDVDLREARGTIGLLGEDIGIHLPRHVQTFIAELPGVGVALQAAFPVLAVVAIGVAIFEATEKLKKHEEEVEKAKTQMTDLTIATGRHAEALEISRLKIEDHIRALTGQPARNGIEIALKEAKKAADELADSIQKDINKEAELLKTQVQGGFSKYLSGPNASQDMIAGYLEYAHKREKLSQEIALAETDANKQGLQQQLKDLDKNWSDRVTFELGKTRDKLKNPEKMSVSTDFGTEEVDVVPKEQLQDKEELLINLALLNKNLQQQEVEGAKIATGQKKVAGLEDLQNTITRLDKQWAETKKVLDAQTKETIAAYELQKTQGQITEEQFTTLKQAALDKQYQAEINHFEKIKALQAGHPALVKQIQAEEDVLTANHNAQIIEGFTKTLEAQKKGLQELDKLNQEFYQKQEQEQTKATNAAIKAIADKNKAWLADMALIQGEGNRHIAQIDHEIANLQRLIAQYHLEGNAAASVYARIHQLSVQRQKDLDEEMRRSGKLGQVFHATMDEMIRDGQQWQLKVANTFKQSVDEMNRSFASFVTTGKFNWQQLASGAIEQIIEIGLQWVESHILMMAMNKIFGAEKGAQNVAQATSNVAVAGTEALASVPWPLNIAAAAETEALGAGLIGEASVGFYSRGGIVPDDMPAFLHKKEMVLPAHVAQHVIHSVSGGGSNGQAQSVHYNPVIMGNADEAKLHAHFERWARAQARKRGHRFN
jgi:hypothetical protein